MGGRRDSPSHTFLALAATAEAGRNAPAFGLQPGFREVTEIAPKALTAAACGMHDGICGQVVVGTAHTDGLRTLRTFYAHEAVMYTSAYDLAFLCEEAKARCAFTVRFDAARGIVAACTVRKMVTCTGAPVWQVVACGHHPSTALLASNRESVQGSLVDALINVLATPDVHSHLLVESLAGTYERLGENMVRLNMADGNSFVACASGCAVHLTTCCGMIRPQDDPSFTALVFWRQLLQRDAFAMCFGWQCLHMAHRRADEKSVFLSARLEAAS